MKLYRMSAGLLVLLPSLALAAPAKKEVKHTKQETEVQATQTKLTKPEAPPVQGAKPGGPVITLDQFLETKKGELQNIIDQQITKMQKLAKVTPADDPQKPDFFYRLGELYAEKERFHNFEARRLDQKIFDAPAGEKSRLKSEQAGHEKKEQDFLFKAVQNYVEATKYKKYGRMDEVLFRLAYLLTAVKKEDQAREFFHRLIKDYPNSKYIPNAYLSFAEYFFGKGEMDSAMKFYEKVESFPKADIYGYAVYKKGWCWINLGEHKKALEIFVRVVKDIAPKLGKKGESLQKEAKKDIVKAYAHVGTPEKAWEFFQNTGGDYAPRMIESLADIFWEQGKFPESSKTFRKIISNNPDSPRICEWQGKIVRNTLSQGTKRDQVQEIQRHGAVFDMVNKMKDVKKDQLEECRNSYHDTTKELALIWHKEAQKTKNPDTYKLAAYLYKEFLDHFPKEKDAYDMSFYYGELLFILEDWRNAAEQYTKVVEMNPSGKWTKEAAYAAVISWKNALNVDDEGQGADSKQLQEEFKKGKHDPRPIPEYQQKMLSAFDTYIKYVPDAKELVPIMYRKARIYYEYNHFEDAAKYFGDIVEKHTSDELALYSANLMLDCLNAIGKTKEVVRWVDRFIDDAKYNPIMKDKEFALQMVSLKADTYDIEARDFEKQKNFKECGRSMEAAADTKPDSPKHAERLWNAGNCYQNAQLIGQALRVRARLIKEHEKDPLANKALFKVASGYHQLASYGKAAETYETYANKFPGEKNAVAALGNATAFRIGLQEPDKALEDLRNFIKFYGQRKPQDAANAFFQMGDVYEKDKKMDDLAKHLEEYLKKWGVHGGVDKQMIAHFRLGEMAWKASCAPKQDLDGKETSVGACIDIKRKSPKQLEILLAKMNKEIKDKKKKIKEKLKTTCGAETKGKITVFDRNKTVAKKAQDHFDTVLKLWAKGDAIKKIPTDKGDPAVRAALAAYAAAGAAFYKAESEYETFLRMKFPEGLDFQQPTQYDTPKKAADKKKKFEESQKKFTGYLDEKSKLAIKLVGDGKANKGLYGGVIELKSAHWFIASAGRIGQVWQNFSDQLYTAEIPKDLKEQDEWGNRPREIYCDTLVDKAEPIEAKAIEGFEICLRGATEQSWFNEWSRLCEVELNQMRPSDYPLSSEIKPEAGYVATTMANASMVEELPGAEDKSEAAKETKDAKEASGGGGQP